MRYTSTCACPLTEADRVRLAGRYSGHIRRREARKKELCRKVIGVVALAAIMIGIFRAAAALVSGV